MQYLKILMFAITISLVSCDSKKQQETSIVEKNNLEDFDSFYDKFHSDSLFQMSRIHFPLEGEFVDGFEKTAWKKENWSMLKTKIFDVDTAQYKVTYKKTDTTFVEQCLIPNSGFSTEYRFKTVKDKWFLVYASDLNL